MSQPDTRAWWRDAAIYQVYVRSFADGNGDGVGDLAGVRARLPYLKDLGIDAIWFNPWYVSPQADGGYDVTDYREIDPLFGTLAEAEQLIAEAHALGIRVIVDVVPNHCSDQTPWFQAALAAGPGSPERERFWFRPGKGEHGELPPTNWTSNFGGGTWTRVTEPDGTPGEWYLHLFDGAQPDFNWDHPDVRQEFEDVLRFWFDRGADGIRIDSAALLTKDATLPEVGTVDKHPFEDRDDVHDVYRAWRRIAEEYGGRALIGEVWMPDVQRFTNYLRPDEMHTAFNLNYLCAPWDADKLREVIDETLSSHAPVQAPATWVLSNHDVTRHISRYGRQDTSFSFKGRDFGTPFDLELGTRRARAAILLSLALPGSSYLYQGEELGLWEVEDIPDALKQDPMWHRTAGVDPGRDGCRVPLPWSGDAAPFGFSPDDAPAKPWLPQPAAWKAYTAQAQTGDPASMLELYRKALHTRHAEPALGDGEMAWLDSAPQVLAFRRPGNPDVICVANLSTESAKLPAHSALLVASGDLDGENLPPDTTVWLRP
ncbi:glycoside hydrolase family 13 protein [Catellatospora sp. KI3]|uniref:glycoside hydrolase family 13 protein n=1 Tax=Catellatospora sp. KI3 TaxID=3041620 RepID=UPI0024827921|nr:glycoside hydrolase family 13 protein [Catellatospora sp. KI3]MDI1464978.1 glycoside hydrolase family 13 protein [Catellatospora sp. KI3]